MGRLRTHTKSKKQNCGRSPCNIRVVWVSITSLNWLKQKKSSQLSEQMVGELFNFLYTKKADKESFSWTRLWDFVEENGTFSYFS